MANKEMGKFYTYNSDYVGEDKRVKEVKKLCFNYIDTKNHFINNISKIHDYILKEKIKDLFLEYINDNFDELINVQGCLIDAFDEEIIVEIGMDILLPKYKKNNIEVASSKKKENNNWISVQEKSPNKDGFYLVFLNLNTNIDEVKIIKAWFDTNSYKFIDYNDVVIAWQPLPEPYEKEEK